MLDYYDRSGIPITDIHEWERPFADHEYKRVARSKVISAADPTKSFDVSTVWLGLNHNYAPSGPPLIFETMVFADLRDAGFQLRHDDRDRVHNLVDSYGEDEDPS